MLLAKKVMLARVEIHAKAGRLAKRAMFSAKTPATVFTIHKKCLYVDLLLCI
jgi:hypothetical protein